jgi:glycosyltransferase involved in cell wall biosynthesis
MPAIRLTTIVPVFNEEQTVKKLLEKLLTVKGVKEVIVVNDGSTDGTKKILNKLKHKKLKVLHKPNGGKGSAVRHGLKHATGTHVLIQDADLEYDPDDIGALLEPVKKGRASVVFGSRFLGPHSNLLFWHKQGNAFLNFLVNVMYNTTLSDMETCYKIAPTKVLRELGLESNAFELEPEITCKLLRSGIYIYEVPISYVGRDFSQGKKITWRDGITAVSSIWKYRWWEPKVKYGGDASRRIR